MSMKVYAFDLMPWPHLAQPSYYPDSNRLYDPALGRQVYDEHFRQMELYEECGYDAICINEHHAKPYGLMPSPNLIAAVLTQRTKKIKIGIFGNLPALHANPVRLAEEVAMLDVMSGGRIISAFVRGAPTGSAYRSSRRVRAVFDRYRELAGKHGWTPGPEHCHLVRHVYVAETNARAREEAGPHIDYFWQKLLSYHRGSMALMGQSAPPRPARIAKAEDVPLYERGFDFCQREGLTRVGAPGYVIREIHAQTQELGAGVPVG